MAYSPHSLLTFGGTMGSGADAEIWQCGVRVAQKDSGGAFHQLADLAGYATSINNGLVGVMQSGSSTTLGSVANYARLAWCKVANIRADGKYDGLLDATGGSNPGTGAPTATGVSTQGSLPWFTTVAVSFRTNSPSKWGRHGRIYMPIAAAAGTGGSPRLAAGTVTQVVNIGKLLLTNISKPAGTGNNVNPIRPIVASNHAGELYEIVEVRVGDVIDVQRRRKDKLREAYTISAWS
jgi:hypothetical protein